ncbi:MAG: NAD(P)H-hydrate epimerase, partial [Thermoflexia bacterium]
MKVVTVAQMRAIEAASDAAGHTYAAMMERAGRAVARALMARRDVVKKRILILVGPGNNGGDGLVAARYLAQAGADVVCYLARPRDPQADPNYRALQEQGIPCLLADEDTGSARLRKLTSAADAVIDALLGTGATPPLKGTIAQILRTVSEAIQERTERPSAELTRVGGIPEPPAQSRPFIVAVDGPSGMDFDTGSLDDLALWADLTVTFAYPKRGHFRFPAAAAVGELLVADIGTDPALAADVDLELVTPEMVRKWLPPRPPDAHKGTFGRALI